MDCRSSENLTIVYGAHTIESPHSGCSVGELRDGLRDVLNIGREARPYVHGNPVDDDYVPAAGAYLEYMKEAGSKGVGKIWTKEEFMQAFHMSEADWQNWTERGLFFNTMSDGTVVLNETEVDAWMQAQRGHAATVRVQRPASPYLTAVEAAQYLGISIKSLYGAVERRHLVPLRGPRRSYRFTVEMLDEYLKR